MGTILESSNENLFSFQIKLQGVRGIPATMVFFITLDQKKVNFKQVSGDLQSPKIVTTLGTMPHSENEPQLQVKSAPKNNMITHFCNSFLANFNNLENDKTRSDILQGQALFRGVKQLRRCLVMLNNFEKFSFPSI